jgi:hypothetical protein
VDDPPDLVPVGLTDMFESGRLLGRFGWKITEDPAEGAGPGERRAAGLHGVPEPDAELAPSLDPHINITFRYYNFKIISMGAAVLLGALGGAERASYITMLITKF